MNTLGLWYRACTVGGIMFLLALLMFLLDILLHLKRRKQKQKSKLMSRKDLTLVCLFLIIATLYCSYYSYKAISPNISCYEGSFEYSNRKSRIPLTSTYMFSNNDDECKKGFHIDAISKKEIFNYNFEKGVRYIIWYDEETKVILKIEKSE